jgi:hypothetical protein
LVCSEHDPIDCHRCLLVGRALTERQHGISHIMKDGSLMTQSDLEIIAICFYELSNMVFDYHSPIHRLFVH